MVKTTGKKLAVRVCNKKTNGEKKGNGSVIYNDVQNFPPYYKRRPASTGKKDDEDEIQIYYNPKFGKMLRVICSKNQCFDYDKCECVQLPLYNTPCGPNYARDPITGECAHISLIKPRKGYRWTDNGVENIGVSVPTKTLKRTYKEIILEN